MYMIKAYTPECRETKEAQQGVHLGVKTVIFFLCIVSLCWGLVISSWCLGSFVFSVLHHP